MEIFIIILRAHSNTLCFWRLLSPIAGIRRLLLYLSVHQVRSAKRIGNSYELVLHVTLCLSGFFLSQNIWICSVTTWQCWCYMPIIIWLISTYSAKLSARYFFAVLKLTGKIKKTREKKNPTLFPNLIRKKIFVKHKILNRLFCLKMWFICNIFKVYKCD